MKICKHCGKEFASNKNAQKFCNPICRATYFKDKKRKTDMSERECMQCGKKFIPKVYNQQFCSLECKNFKRDRYCIYCGKKLTANKSKYCSVKCKNEYNKQGGCIVIHKGRKQKKTNALADLNAKARAEGLTYGQYMAKYGYKRSDIDV